MRLNFSLKGFAAAHDDMVAQARAKAKPVDKPAPQPRRASQLPTICEMHEKRPVETTGLFLFKPLGRLERHRHAVHAIAQAGRLGTVVEDMAQMAAAAAAMHFGAAPCPGWCRLVVCTALGRGR